VRNFRFFEHFESAASLLPFRGLAWSYPCSIVRELSNMFFSSPDWQLRRQSNVVAS
jgi:hypothetical protein